MAEDWDLTAVVRGCKSATNTASSAAAANTTAVAATKPVAFSEDNTFCNWLVKNKEVSSDDLFFDFPDLIEPRADAFDELQQFLPNPTTTNGNNPSTNSYGPLVIPNPPTISDFGGSAASGQQQHHAQQIQLQIQQNPQQEQQQEQQQINHFLPINNTAMSPHFHPGVPPPRYTEFPGQQVAAPQPLVPRPGYMRPIMPIHPGVPNPRLPFPMHLTHQSPRARRRKSQQKKMVREVTQENLASDLWAWRKYGQKPIKGSPHPRNYYRCSSSKGCAARKQVERSTKDPDIFIVTYSGDHTHPRPTHRNSLAGSTRNKLSAAAPAVNKDPISSPTPQSAAEGAADDEEDMNEDEDEVEDFLLLDPKMSDEMLEEEMKQMGCGTSSSGSGADDLSDRAAEGATVRGGC